MTWNSFFHSRLNKLSLKILNIILFLEFFTMGISMGLSLCVCRSFLGLKYYFCHFRLYLSTIHTLLSEDGFCNDSETSNHHKRPHAIHAKMTKKYKLYLYFVVYTSIILLIAIIQNVYYYYTDFIPSIYF